MGKKSCQHVKGKSLKPRYLNKIFLDANVSAMLTKLSDFLISAFIIYAYLVLLRPFTYKLNFLRF